MLEIKLKGDKVWLFVCDGCLVQIFDTDWEAQSHCLLKYGRRAVWAQ